MRSNRRHSSGSPRRNWRPPSTSPYSITDDEVRRGRALMANDVCCCGHKRSEHPANSHGVIRTGCGVKGCRCQDYGRRKGWNE